MKQPRPKPHLIFSEWPLANGQTFDGLCGKEVRKCVFLKEVIAEPGSSIKREDMRGVCAKCWNAEWPVQRYVYLMIPGESAKQGEAE